MEIAMIAWYGLTMFVSAGLLFLVQPMIAKMMLPLMGGAPAVWTACMLFFQTLLLAGYAYADLMPRLLGTRRHAALHLVIIILPLFLLPIQISDGQPPADSENPVPWVLLTLLIASGLPFFVLATGAPLIQRWFAATSHRAADDPYFLYAASNVGSLLALLSYPLVIEPFLSTAQQSLIWASGYALLVFLIAGCVWWFWRQSHDSVKTEGSVAEPLSMTTRLRWIALAFVPSSLMLGVTTYATTDISPIPLLWVVPLSLYLLSFILAFSRLPRIFYQLSVMLLPALIAAVIVARLDLEWFGLHWQFRISEMHLIGLHLATFFIAALLCHGELAMRRPSVARLTEFYILIAIGGMAGGLFNSIVAPLTFDRIIEYPLLFAAVCLLRPHVGALPNENGAVQRTRTASAYSRLVTAGWLVVGFVAALCFAAQTLDYVQDPEVKTSHIRNFFGTLVATHDPRTGISQLYHGTIIHGTQDLTSPMTRARPLHPCFGISSGIGRLFAMLQQKPPRVVGVVGLGAGTLACYGHAGQHWIYYEINPAVLRVARNPNYFTYLTDAEHRGVAIETVLGDARLSINRSPVIHDLLVIDAFTSDAIPIHLVTRQALKLYLSKVAPDGLISFHVSNPFVDLTPVLANLARDLGLTCAFYSNERDIHGSWWLVLARHPNDLGPLFISHSKWQRFLGRPDASVWTDDFSNLYSVFWPGGVGHVPQAALER
jgi:hypothetical protein